MRRRIVFLLLIVLIVAIALGVLGSRLR